MDHAKDQLASANGKACGYDALQHSSTYCAGVDGSSTAVIAVLQQPNVLEVGAMSHETLWSVYQQVSAEPPECSGGNNLPIIS